MNNLELLIRELPGVHFREDNINWITCREDTLLEFQKQIEYDYNQFLAECYEAEDEIHNKVIK
jgi:hypothetical protein